MEHGDFLGQKRNLYDNIMMDTLVQTYGMYNIKNEL